MKQNNGGGEVSKQNKNKDSVAALSVESQMELKEIESLRNHILSYRTTTTALTSSRAVKCAIAALDLERERIMRDEKLKRKFANQREESIGSGTTGGEVVMVSERASASSEVDPTIRASLEILEQDDTSTRRRTTTSAAAAAVGKDNAVAAEEDDEWQDILEKTEECTSSDDVLMDGGDVVDQHLGTQLAQISISSLSEGNVRVSNPLSLIAVAIHSILRSDMLAFQCTGIPPNTTATVSGFAAPIRELPKSIYMPKDWDSNSISYNPTTHALGNIVLRYRKKDVDKPMVLHVSLLPVVIESDEERYGTSTTSFDQWHDITNIILAQYLATSKSNTIRKFMWERMPCDQLGKLMVQVNFGPSTTSTDDIGTNVTFPLGRHVNVLSLTAAIASLQQQQSQTSTAVAAVPPALHYKSLSTLLLTFVRTFDVGNVYDSAAAPMDGELSAANIKISGSKNNLKMQAKMVISDEQHRQQQQQQEQEYYYHKTEGTKSTQMIGSESLREPNRQDRGGDFSGDLLFTPSDPLLNPNLPLPRPTGNLMGPNHPLFNLEEQQQYDDDVIGGQRMRPRFDPYGPPGGPTDPSFVDPTFPGRGRANRGRGRGRGGPGDPNPDHLRPPRDFFS